MKNEEYLIIPKAVFEMQELSPSAKILYGLIKLYSRREGYCWASNKYLSENCGCSPRNISRLISQLSQHGLIRIEEVINERHMTSRRLYITDLCPDKDKNVNGDTKNTSNTSRHSFQGDNDNFGAHNNKKYNNKNYNYNNNYSQKNYFGNGFFGEALRDDNIDYDEIERIIQASM